MADHERNGLHSIGACARLIALGLGLSQFTAAAAPPRDEAVRRARVASRSMQTPRGAPRIVDATEPARPRPGSATLLFDPSWRRCSAVDYTITSVALSGALTALIIGPSSNPARGGVLFDDDVRRGLRISDPDGQRAARTVSDALVGTLLTYPFVVDALAVAAWRRKSPDVALQMALINAETLAITAVLQTSMNVLVSRERPYGAACGKTLSNDLSECSGNNRYYSFFSCHTAFSFAAAGLISSHHCHLALYGGGVADGIPCAVGFTLAAATGSLRIMGDMHYATDVLTGALIGTATGLGVPWLLHYRSRARNEAGTLAGARARLARPGSSPPQGAWH